MAETIVNPSLLARPGAGAALAPPVVAEGATMAATSLPAMSGPFASEPYPATAPSSSPTAGASYAAPSALPLGGVCALAAAILAAISIAVPFYGGNDYKVTDQGTSWIPYITCAALLLVGGLAALGRSRAGFALAAGAGLGFAAFQTAIVVVYLQLGDLGALRPDPGPGFVCSTIAGGIGALLGICALGTVVRSRQQSERIPVWLSFVGIVAAGLWLWSVVVPPSSYAGSWSDYLFGGGGWIAVCVVLLLAVIPFTSLVGYGSATSTGVSYALGGMALWVGIWLSNLSTERSNDLGAPLTDSGQRAFWTITTIAMVAVALVALVVRASQVRQQPWGAPS
jgi:hypothetical protein